MGKKIMMIEVEDEGKDGGKKIMWGNNWGEGKGTIKVMREAGREGTKGGRGKKCNKGENTREGKEGKTI